jgi:hypothetical protein
MPPPSVGPLLGLHPTFSRPGNPSYERCEVRSQGLTLILQDECRVGMRLKAVRPKASDRLFARVAAAPMVAGSAPHGLATRSYATPKINHTHSSAEKDRDYS